MNNNNSKQTSKEYLLSEIICYLCVNIRNHSNNKIKNLIKERIDKIAKLLSSLHDIDIIYLDSQSLLPYITFRENKTNEEYKFECSCDQFKVEAFEKDLMQSIK